MLSLSWYTCTQNLILPLIPIYHTKPYNFIVFNKLEGMHLDFNYNEPKGIQEIWNSNTLTKTRVIKKEKSHFNQMAKLVHLF